MGRGIGGTVGGGMGATSGGLTGGISKGVSHMGTWTHGVTEQSHCHLHLAHATSTFITVKNKRQIKNKNLTFDAP